MENTITTIKTSFSTTFLIDALKQSYVGIILTVLGLFALGTAVLISYPAIAYFASKF